MICALLLGILCAVPRVGAVLRFDGDCSSEIEDDAEDDRPRVLPRRRQTKSGQYKNQSNQPDATDQGIVKDNGALVSRHGGHDKTADRGASRHCRLIAVRELLVVLCVLFR
jgi:hypothetical protein